MDKNNSNSTTKNINMDSIYAMIGKETSTTKANNQYGGGNNYNSNNNNKLYDFSAKPLAQTDSKKNIHNNNMSPKNYDYSNNNNTNTNKQYSLSQRIDYPNNNNNNSNSNNNNNYSFDNRNNKFLSNSPKGPTSLSSNKYNYGSSIINGLGNSNGNNGNNTYQNDYSYGIGKDRNNRATSLNNQAFKSNFGADNVYNSGGGQNNYSYGHK